MIIRKNKILNVLLILFLGISCSNKTTDTKSKAIHQDINEYLESVMELYNIPGLALAVIKDNKTVYKQYFGKASLETDSLVNHNTLFRIFSSTKLITATSVFRLVQEGRLHIEDRISDHISELPGHWRKIKINNLLSHSSGLPDMIRFKNSLSDQELMDELGNAPMDFETGSQFRYNQTNFWLLSKIIENNTGIPFEKYVHEHQFPTIDQGFLFSSDSQEQIANRATRYFFNPKAKAFVADTNNNGRRGHSGNGVNITLDRFMEWNQRLDANTLLTKKTKAQMWEPFTFGNQKDEFLHGWGHYKTNELVSYGFTGGNLSAFRKFVRDDLTIILLSNGYQIPVYDIVVNDIARMVLSTLRSKKLTKENSVMRLVMHDSLAKASTSFAKLKSENPDTGFDNLKSNINGIGNTLVRANKPEKAFQVFKWNADANPGWWIALASLAEAYQMKGNHKKALTHYEAAIQLNEWNEYGYNEIMAQEINKIKKEE